jgi:hypothetical protein
VRGAFEQTQTGWVYRSDAEPEIAAPSNPGPALTVPAHAPRERAASAPHSEPARLPTWIAAGFYVMALPFAITAGLMIAPMVAPMFWIFTARQDDKR